MPFLLRFYNVLQASSRFQLMLGHLMYQYLDLYSAMQGVWPHIQVVTHECNGDLTTIIFQC